MARDESGLYGCVEDGDYDNDGLRLDALDDLGDCDVVYGAFGITWRVIDDFPNYEVSNTGLVRNATTGRVMAQYKCYRGYAQVSLFGVSRRGRKRPFSRRVHLLVARAFLGPRPGKWIIDHVDHDKANPHLSNLRYISSSDNTLRAIGAGRFRPVPPKNEKKAKAA